MDLNGIERIQFNALGGADKITVGDLSGTDVKQVAVDLSAQPGSGTGDGAADTVIVNATLGDDHISVAGSATAVTVSGLAAEVTVTGAEPNLDKLLVNGVAGSDTLQVNGSSAADTIGVVTDGQNVAVTGVGNIIVEANGVEDVIISAGAGNDMINASGLIAGLTQLTIDGGAGDDFIVGSQGADTLLAGAGNDTVIGGRGSDVALLGSGDDTFVWNPGDGSDVVEGQGGFDTLLFNGANEQWAIQLPRATLVVYDPDTVLPIREITTILRQSCHAWTYKEVLGVGHMAPLTRPDLINPLVTSFLHQ